MRRKVVASVLIGTVLAATLFTGCGGSGKSKSSSDEGGVKEFTAFLQFRVRKLMMIMRFRN